MCVVVASIIVVVFGVVFYIYISVQTMVWLPVFGIFNVRTAVVACTRGLCADTVRESAPEGDPGRKIPCRTGDSNPRQYCAWLFSTTLLFRPSYPAPYDIGNRQPACQVCLQEVRHTPDNDSWKTLTSLPP